MSIVKNGQITLYCCFNEILYNEILNMSKGLELVSSFQHWVKNMLEMFVKQHTNI